MVASLLFAMVARAAERSLRIVLDTALHATRDIDDLLPSRNPAATAAAFWTERICQRVA